MKKFDKTKLRTETILCHAGENRSEHQGAVVPPIYQNSLFTFDDWDGIDAAFSNPKTSRIYTRGNNPSALITEEKIAAIANGERAKLFASGMGAISSSILHFVKNGDHIITINNVYGPAANFMKNYLVEKCGIETTFVSGESVADFENALKANTRLIYLESPSSAIFSLQDIKAIVALAKKHNIHTVIDNTWATPLFQKPLDMGVDVEVHSCSKYLNGHSDVVAGVAIGKREIIDAIQSDEAGLLGAKIAPFEAWLIMRSLRTLSARMGVHQESTKKVTEFLEQSPKVVKVNYPGLNSFPQKKLADSQMTGCTGLFSFELKTENLNEIKNFVNSLNLFSIGVSWGGHESLVYAPAISYLKEMTPEHFKKTGLKYGVIRISIGLENVEDLIEDLEQALNKIK